MSAMTITAIVAAFEQIRLIGAGTAFLLPSQPVAGSLMLFLNGLLLTSGVDYTVSTATTVTLLKRSITTKDVLTAFYLH